MGLDVRLEGSTFCLQARFFQFQDERKPYFAGTKMPQAKAILGDMSLLAALFHTFCSVERKTGGIIGELPSENELKIPDFLAKPSVKAIKVSSSTGIFIAE
jgi:hypothetical protein